MAAVALNMNTKNNLSPSVIPFYQLKTFVDAEYGAIFGYGLYMLAKQITLCREIFKAELQTNSSWKIGEIVDYVVGNAIMHSAIATILILLCVFVIFIDEFARRRIIGYLAPCRSIQRFGLNVGTGFWFVLTFMFIQERSTMFWGAIGMSYFFGASWSYYAKKEALTWQKSPVTTDNNVKAKVENWDFFLARLSVYIGYRIIIGVLFCAVMFSVAFYGTDLDFSLKGALYFVGFILLSEGFACFIEHRLVYKHPVKSGRRESGLLISVLPIPGFIRMFIRWLARFSRTKK